MKYSVTHHNYCDDSHTFFKPSLTSEDYGNLKEKIENKGKHQMEKV